MIDYINLFSKYSFFDIRYNELLKNHTSFKIGGPADIFIIPNSLDELIYAIKIARVEKIPYFIMGNGTNLLVKDGGIRGVVIKINGNIDKLTVEGEKIKAQAGALLANTSKFALENNLTGMEFASGIPGTVGGAVMMNAGAYNGEIKDIVSKVTVLTKDNEIVTYTNEEMNFGYRKSRVIEEELVVLEVEFSLKKGKYEDIFNRMQDLNEKRALKQPLELPSAGSTFKRPEGHFAGQLIDTAGLRGLRYKDAQVSQKHCGFIVNLGDATYKDISTLIKIVQKTVKDVHGVDLELEIKVVGEDL
ncbi:UDP-N-acetylmuramate dehydrogenase [Soehngenia longivitae]|uniref:UDP-N-acetylenolpyruvoylglucosamine reductase n=1 Tax=Soehngenia longivitae TaxID=2562294 RepID=A0A4Z0D6A6_9FIRM|nr:UDP-N-acetylmuramate dehydrogenase [Soehngenia longivitae]TFZ40398.1 UDP-N-acetylmuramate dehydrogenase [Soehngenia longivitae]